ncbi:sulfate anion transporter [Rickenella mellea]|uniref:Sulfate anion transporter n=1 Tax=Rickenella mellea TaxID=50990 RepID=A0A4Y7PTY2_9AGAM|nr:sulfate anion transporter [Rickenella mellea]TDL17990.1 sulfate anion transporter [Rickenella mellea]
MDSGLASPRSERSVLLNHDELEAGRRGALYYGLRTPGAQSPDPLKAVTQTRWAYAKYYLPFLDWVPNYSPSLLGGDILAGLTVASILIPQSISYASSLAKLSPLAGLFSAAIPGIVYALLGTSRQLNVAPEAALSLLIGQAVSLALHGDPHDTPRNSDAIGIAVTTVTTLQVGLFSFMLGFFRLGFIDVVLSRALLRGFVSAIAVVIMIEQLIPMFGLVEREHEVNPHTTVDKFIFIVQNFSSHENRPTTLVSFGSLLVLVSFRYLKGFFQRYWFIYRIPEVLIVVIVSTVLCDVLEWDKDGVAILGNVPIKTGAHFFDLPLRPANLPFLRSTTSTAILVAVVGFLDSIVAAKQNAARFGYSISPNRELVALGAANIASAFVPGTLPAFGSITRSRINADVGGRSQMASLVCSAVVLLATFFLLPSLYYLPKCVLAAIISLTVYSLLSEAPHDLIFFWKMRAWMELTLIFLTFVCTIVWNVEVGVVVSVVISLLVLVRKSSKMRMSILGRIPGTARWKPINEHPEASEDNPAVLVVRIRESLDFANTSQLIERLRRMELYGIYPSHPSDPPTRTQPNALVFHLSDVEKCDASAAQILLELLEMYKSRGVAVFFAHIRTAPKITFEKAGIVQLVGEESFYETVGKAMERIEMIEREVARL